jgi:hypothetical protein
MHRALRLLLTCTAVVLCAFLLAGNTSFSTCAWCGNDMCCCRTGRADECPPPLGDNCCSFGQANCASPGGTLTRVVAATISPDSLRFIASGAKGAHSDAATPVSSSYGRGLPSQEVTSAPFFLLHRSLLI